MRIRIVDEASDQVKRTCIDHQRKLGVDTKLRKLTTILVALIRTPWTDYSTLDSTAHGHNTGSVVKNKICYPAGRIQANHAHAGVRGGKGC